jgi:large repetitive protein
VVRARLAPAGVGWPRPLPDGWTRTSANVATYTVTFDAVTCSPAALTDPTITQATCVNGAVTAPTIGLATTTGITYTVDPAGPYAGTKATTVTVTATVFDGFALEGTTPAGFAPSASQPIEPAEGWTLVSPAVATLSIRLPRSPTCPRIQPATPEISPPTCVAGGAAAPSIAPVEMEGVAYQLEPAGPWEPGDSVIVTATITNPEAGWARPLAGGWHRVNPTTATLEVTFTEIACLGAQADTPGPSTTTGPTPTTTAPSGTSPTSTVSPASTLPGGELVRTGAVSKRIQLVVATLLLALGSLLVAIAARRSAR